MPRSNLRKWETLESRDLFAAFNVPWPEIDHLTISFARDGTEIAGQVSTLHQSFRGVIAEDQWQLAILKAFQTWAVESNINIALVGDNGDPFNTLGFKQGDVRFGDVRIGAMELGSDVIAVANPYDAFIANTWVGDVFLNRDLVSIADTDDPVESLYGIMLHEAGHVFGIAHNSDPNSPMFPEFDGSIRFLAKNDRQDLHALYGERRDDQFDSLSPNETILDATPIQMDAWSNSTMSIAGDIGSLQDRDFYKLAVPSGTENLSVRASVSDHSLLLSHVSILDRNGHVLTEAFATDPRDNDFIFDVPVPPGEELYLQVSPATETVFGIGAYRIDLSADDPGNLTTGEISKSAISDSTAIEKLLSTTPGYVEHTYYEIEDRLDVAQPTSVFRVQSVDLGSEFKNVMTVIIASDSDSVDHLQVEIMDRNGNPLDAVSIPNDLGKIAMQIEEVDSAQEFLVQVHNPQSNHLSTHYEIEVDFALDGSRLETYVNETLDSETPEFTRMLRVMETQGFHFVMAATDWNLPSESSTRFEIIDESGETVFTMLVPDGATRSGDVILNPADYRVRFSSPNLPVDSRITFQLSGISMSSPIGPLLRETVQSAVESNTASPTDHLTFFWTGEELDQSQTAFSDVVRTSHLRQVETQYVGTIDHVLTNTFSNRTDTDIPSSDRGWHPAPTSLREIPTPTRRKSSTLNGSTFPRDIDADSLHVPTRLAPTPQTQELFASRAHEQQLKREDSRVSAYEPSSEPASPAQPITHVESQHSLRSRIENAFTSHIGVQPSRCFDAVMGAVGLGISIAVKRRRSRTANRVSGKLSLFVSNMR